MLDEITGDGCAIAQSEARQRLAADILQFHPGTAPAGDIQG